MTSKAISSDRCRISIICQFTTDANGEDMVSRKIGNGSGLQRWQRRSSALLAMLGSAVSLAARLQASG